MSSDPTEPDPTDPGPTDPDRGVHEPSGYGPQRFGSADAVETHISTLVFMGDRVYKYKKPVRFEFLDFSTAELRRVACHNEVVLNRRLAPDVYLGVAEQFDEHGRPDYAVVMRRMDPSGRLAALVNRGADDLDDHLTQVAEMVAEFHRRAERSPVIDADATAAAIRHRWDAGAQEMEPFVGAVLDSAVFATVVDRYRRFVDGRGALFDARINAGHICDGHGDLQAEDVFCTPDGPRVLDCIEFDAHLRHVDVLADVAFLAMDLERLGNGPASDRFVEVWAAALGGDVVHPALLHHYIAERAFVRAKVACLRLGQRPVDAPSAQQHAHAARTLLSLCARHLGAAAPRLVLVGGSPGTGKTTVATELGRATRWPVLHSDVVRKQRLGLDPATRPTAGQARRLYDPGEVAATYADVLSSAADHLALGQSVIIDASWTSDDERVRARGVADAAHADVVELHCVCDPDEARRRVANRLRTPNPPDLSDPAGASDATPDIADLLASRSDPWPQAQQLDTGAAMASVVSAALEALGPR
jgi:uncharacterized protein